MSFKRCVIKLTDKLKITNDVVRVRRLREWVDCRQYLRDKKNEIEYIIRNLCDEDSKHIYRQAINHRYSWNLDFNDIYDKNNEQYFIPQVIKVLTAWGGDFTFFDCGAYVGDTSDALMRITNGQVNHVYAFEPDYETYQTLFKKYGSDTRFSLINAGCWSNDTELKFVPGHDISSKIQEVQSPECKYIKKNDKIITIPVRSIDGFNARGNIFIKMDIEGSEMKALEGAENTINKHKSILAICIYHSKEDMIDVPKWIIEKCGKNYSYYIRHHSCTFTESVFYAIPKDW